MRYIAIEGVDGAGKSTQMDLLKEIYLDAIFTLEPGATPLGNRLRDLALHHNMSDRSRALLFLADRAEHIEQVIKPNEHRLIISDRSLISGIAYALNGSNQEILKTLNFFATDGVIPTMVILLEMNLDLIRSRLDRELDLIESAGFEKLLEVQKNIKIACDLLDIPFEPIDASLSIETITNKIKDLIDAHRA